VVISALRPRQGAKSTATPMRAPEQLKSEKQQRTSTDSGNVGS
jgi:hypothetical protein